MSLHPTDQDFGSAAALGVDHLQLTVFHDPDKTAFPVGNQPICSPVVALPGPLLIGQGRFIAPGKYKSFPIIKRIHRREFSATFAVPNPFQE
jgi:hypothetical protein